MIRGVLQLFDLSVFFLAAASSGQQCEEYDSRRQILPVPLSLALGAYHFAYR